MIMVLAGERFPGRSAAVSGSLSSAALVGTIVYPPVMGLLSVTVGLAIAMFGNGLLALACAGALVMVGRRSVRDVVAGT
jgi:fucose permease